MTIRQAFWNCPHCGTAGIPGRETVCPTCHRERPQSVALYVPGDEPETEPVDRGSDDGSDAGQDAGGEPAPTEWPCAYCGVRNPADDGECRGCGAPRREALGAEEKPVAEAPAPEPAAPPAPAGCGGCLGCGCGSLVGAVVLFVILIALLMWFAPKGPVGGEDLVPAVVTAKSATRSVVVERRGPGRNGVWEKARVVTSNGTDSVPAWPTPALGRRERAGKRTESYTVTYRKEDGRSLQVSTWRMFWTPLAVGEHVGLRIKSDDASNVQALPADSLAECRKWHLHRFKTEPPGLGCSPQVPEKK